MADLDLRERRLQTWRDELRTLELDAQRDEAMLRRRDTLEQGRAALWSGDLAAAEKCFRSVAQDAKDDPSGQAARAGLVRVCRLAGEREVAADRLEKARAYYEEWAKLEENNKEPRRLLVELDRKLQKASRRRNLFIFGGVISGMLLLVFLAWSLIAAGTASSEHPLSLSGDMQVVAAELPEEQVSPTTVSLALSATERFVEDTATPGVRLEASPSPLASLATPYSTATLTPLPVRSATATPIATSTVVFIPQPPPTVERLPDELAGVAERYEIDSTKRFMVVALDSQQMIIWEPGSPLRILPVSTGGGPEGYVTPPWLGLVGKYVGTISSFGTFADDAWYLFESLGSILIHGAPYRLVDGQKVYEALDALGSYPASHGCIRLSPENARWLTEWDPEDVPLVILPVTYHLVNPPSATRE